MDANRLIKWVVIIAIVVFAWKVGIPWVKKKFDTHAPAAAEADNSCITAARQASEKWGSGLHSFVNPPYDLASWGAFRNDVETKIAFAEAACKDSSQSCVAGRDAMH